MNRLAFVATVARRLDRAALLRSTAIGAVAALAMVSQAAAQPAPNARPQGGQVVAGSAAITNNPNATIILQSTNRAAIDWKSFDVGRNQSVDFHQPNSGSVTLNRVAGGDPSAIAGRINANGQLVITNPSGVTFYQGSEVNAQSIVVSAAGISNQNFMAGRMVFDRAPNPNAKIDNRGVITVKQAGLAALVAPSVANSGVINARLGRVVLAGASVHTLDMYGDGLVAIDVSKQVRTAPVGPDGRVVDALVTNTGTIAADGGVVQLSAKAADGVVQNLVRAGGTIHANTIGNRTGAIEIAGNGGSVVIEGRLSADGQAPGTVGGTIAMAGSTTTTIRPTARISANGASGGGLIAVGTTLSRAKGSGPAPAGTSRNTIVAAGAQISADATVAGNGGRVTVLSTRHTDIGGTLTARGGSAGGDGGTVELSGEIGFRLTGTADTSAPHGNLGSIVLDPRDLTISTTGTNQLTPVGGVDPNIGAGANGTTTDAYVTPAQLQALTGNIHLQTTRDLTVANSVTFGNQQVFLEAGRNIIVDFGVTVSSQGAVILTAASAGIPGNLAGGGITIAGSVTTTSTLALNAGTGGVSITGAISASQLSITTTGALTEDAGGGITLTGGLSGTASSVSLGGTGNSIPVIATPGFTTTAGGFSLVDRVALSVGPTGTGQAGGIVVATGQSIVLQTDRLTLNGNATFPALTAPGGSVAIRPNTAGVGVVLTSGTKPGGVLALTTAELSRIAAPTLDIGQPGSPIAGPVSMGGTGDAASIDLTADQITTLGLYTTGQVTQTIGLRVGTVTGTANEVDLSRADNSIQTIADLSATNALTVATSGDLQFAGTTTAGQTAQFSANGNISVAAGTTLSAQTVELDAGGSIALGGSVTAGSGLILNAGSSGIGLTGNISAGFEVSIDTTGPVVQTAGTLSTGDLNGGAGSVLLPSRGNAIDGIGSLFSAFTSTGSFTLVDSKPLTIGNAEGASEGGSGLSVGSGQTITLVTDQLTLADPNGNFVLSAPSGEIAISPFTSSHTIELTAGTSTPGSLSLTTAELALTQASILQLGVADLATGALPTGPVTIATDGNLVDLGVPGYSTLAFLTNGAVTQAGALAVTTVSGQAGSLALPFGTDTSSNFIQNLAGFTTTAGDIALHTSSGLTVSGTVSANGGTGNVTLSSEGTVTTDAQGRNISMVIAGSIAGANVAVDSTNGSLATSGGISQTGGIITAATLSATGGFVDFPNANVVSNLGASTAVDELSLTTVNPLLITGSITSQNASITLNAAGITQAAGTVISANVLDGSSSATTLLANGGNLIGGIGSFNQSAGDFTVATASPTLTFGGDGGVVTAATGSLTFIADAVGQSPESTLTISAPNGTVTFAPLTPGRRIELIGNSGSDTNSLSLTQRFVNRITTNTLRLGLPGTTSSPVNIGNSADAVSLTGIATTLDLESSGAVTEGNGGPASLTVATLIGNTGSVTLGGGNQIATLGGYTSSGSFQLTDDASLLITGPVTGVTSINVQSSGSMSVAGNVTAQNIALGAAGGPLVQENGLINAAGTLELDGSGLVSESVDASITAGTLTGSSGSLNLVSTTNHIGAISNLNTGTATINDAVGLTLGGADSFGDTRLTLLSGNLVVTGAAVFGNLALSVPGSVSTDGGSLAASTLTGSAASLTLASAQIATLGDFTATGDFNLTNRAALTLAGNVSAASIEITTQDGFRNGFGLIPSPISQTGGALSAGSISIASSDTFTQTAGSITATGAVTLSSNGPLALAGFVTGATVGLSANDKTEANPSVEAAPQTMPGTVTQTTGAITAGVLSGTADSYTLTSAANAIGQLGDLTADGATPTLTLVDSQSLAVTGTVSAGDTSLTLSAGDLSIPGNLFVNNLVVSVPGTVSGGGNVTVQGALSGNAGSLAFGGGVNVSTLGAFTSVNGLALAALGSLTVTGPVQDGVSVALSSAGGMTLAGNVTSPIIDIAATTGSANAGDGITVVVPGTISQTSGTLTATGGITLTASDVFTQSGSAVIGGGSGAVSISDEGPMSLGGTIVGGAVTLIAADRPADAASGQSLLSGSIAQNGGTANAASLTAATLTGSSTGTTTLNGTNAIATLTNFSSVGGFTLADGEALSIAGNVTDATSIALSVAGNITQTAGSLRTATLTGNGATVALGSAANQVGTLGAFTATGDFTLADAQSLTIAGRIAAGTGRTLTIADDAPVFAAGGQLVAAAGHVILEADTAGGGLTVGGSGLPVTATLLTIGNALGGPVTIAGTLDASGVGTLDLESAGAVTEGSGGVIVATTLTGTAGSAALTQANRIGTLGTFTTADGFDLTDAQALTVSGNVAATAGNVAITANALTLSGTVTGTSVALSATNGGITQTGGAVIATGTLTLTASGAIAQNAGTATAGALTAATLTGSSGGTTLLTGNANAIGTLAGFSSAGGFSLVDTEALAVTGPVTDTTAISLSTPGALTLSGAITTGNLTLTGGGGITQTGGAIVASGLGGSGAGVSLTQSGNRIGTLFGFASTGDFSLTDGTAVTIAGTVSAGDGRTLTLADDTPTFGEGGALVAQGGTVALREYTAGVGITLGNTSAATVRSNITAATLSVGSPAAGPISITGAFNLTNVGTLDLESGTTISESGTGAIEVNTLTGNGGTVELGGTNTIGTLGGFTSATDFTLNNTQALTVAGPLNAATVNLTVAGGLTLAGVVTAPTSVALTATGAITQTNGTIATGILTGSATSAAFGSAGNAVAALGGFATTGSFALTDTGNLAIGGGLSGSTVALNTTGAITETGLITTGTLTGSASNAALTGGNQVGTLGTFATGTGFTLLDARALAVTGAVSATAGDVAITANTLTLSGTVAGTSVALSSGGSLSQTAGAVSATDTLTLTASGAIAQQGGTLAAAVLTGSSGGAATLNATGNAIGSLAAFNSTGGFALTDGQGLSVTGPVTDTTSIGLNVTGNLSLGGVLTAPAVTLGVSGDIAQTGGGIQATSLTGNGASVGLGSAINQVGTLNAFTATGDFTLADAQSLTVAGRIAAGTGRTLTIADDAPVFAAGGQLVATSGHVVLEADTAGGGLTVGGSGLPVTATLLTIGNALGGPVTIAGTLDASGVGTLDLESAGLVSETGAGLLIAAELTGNAGSATLGGQNRITTLGSFATVTGFSLFDLPRLTVPGTVTAFAGDVVITASALTTSGTIAGTDVALTATEDNLIQTAGEISATGTLTLVVSAGDITQQGGTIAASVLTGSAMGQTLLTSAGNAVATLGDFGDEFGLTLVDGEALAVTGSVRDANSVALSTAGALSLSGALNTGVLRLTAGGAITQPGGSIVANSLTGSGAGVGLTQSGNRIGALDGFASTGDFALTDAQGLTISGPVSAGTGHTLTLTDDAPTFGNGGSLVAQGGTVALREFTAGRGITLGNTAAPPLEANITAATLSLGSTAGGPITITGGFNLTNVGTLDLESGGAIDETGNGAIQVGALTGHGGSASLGGANAIGTLAGFTTANGFVLVDGQSLTLTGPLNAATANLSVTGDLTLAGTVTAQSLTLGATGAIVQTGGTIATGSLSGRATSASFGNAGNAIATLAGFATTGDFTLDDGQSLTVSAPLDPNTVSLTVRGDLALNSSVTGGTVILNATGAITEGAGGAIFATFLTGGANRASLNGGNQVATISGFASQGGFGLNDGRALTVTGPLTDSTGIALTANGPITLAGSIAAPALTLTTTSGGIDQTGGSLDVGDLNGSSAGGIDLGRSGAAGIGTIGNLSAANGISVADNSALQMNGTVAAPTLNVTATGALILNGGTILTDGPSVLTIDAGPGGTATLRQTGTTTIAPFSGGRTTLAVDLPPSGGSVMLNRLNAPLADLTFSLGSGTASGVLFANNLDVLGSGGLVRFTGAVQSRSDTVAAQLSRISPRVSELYTFNGCDIAAVSCTTDPGLLTFTEAAIASLLRPDILSLDQLDLSVTRDRDDPTLLLPNISNQDY